MVNTGIDLTVDDNWRLNAYCRDRPNDDYDTEILDTRDTKTDVAAYQNCRACTEHGNCVRVALKMDNNGEGLVWGGVAVPYRSSSQRYKRAVARLQRIAKVTQNVDAE